MRVHFTLFKKQDNFLVNFFGRSCERGGGLETVYRMEDRESPQSSRTPSCWLQSLHHWYSSHTTLNSLQSFNASARPSGL